MIESKVSIKDAHLLFEEIKNRNLNYKGINLIYNLYEKIKIYYSENMKKISEDKLKRKIEEIRSKIDINKEDERAYIELISVMTKVNGKYSDINQEKFKLFLF